MNLEWFRTHKKFVYWILLPLVGGSMAFFIPGVTGQGGVGVRGPSATIDPIDGKGGRRLTPAELITLRAELTNFYNLPGNQEVSGKQAAQHLLRVAMAQGSGIEMGDAEAKERVFEQIKYQIMMRERSTPELTESVYRKLLAEMKLSPSRFEALSREMGIMGRYQQVLSAYGRAGDAEAFVEFMREKEVARLRYISIKSEDFLAKTKAPTDEEVKTFYEANKTKDEYKTLLVKKPTISAEVLYLDIQKDIAKDLLPNETELKATYERVKDKWKTAGKDGKPDTFKTLEEVKADVEKEWKNDELKKYYENYKTIHYKVEPKAGEPKPAPGEEKFKPFEEVKADVEKKWEDTAKKERPRNRMQLLLNDLHTAETAFDAEESKKPEAERKKFDVAAWAKSKNLVFWVTPEQDQDAYRAGKKEVNAPDAQWAQNLFGLIEEREAQFEKMMEGFRKRFSGADTTDKGVGAARIKSFSRNVVKTLDEAKPAIIEQLKLREAIDMAKKEAERIRGEWAEGKNLPSLEALNEVRGDKSNESAVLAEFFNNAKQVGDVIAVVQEPAEKIQRPMFQGMPVPARKNFNEHFHVAVVIDREVPTWETYKQDTQYDREKARDGVAQSHASSMMSGLQARVVNMGKVDDIEDPRLSDIIRAGQNQ
jgi:hypothetical protein